MNAPVAFRRNAAERHALLAAFHGRPEIRWFGFRGSFAAGLAVVRAEDVHSGHLGGAGGEALNGGVIAAGLDAAATLVAQAHHEGDVATLDLSVRFLRQAPAEPALRFVAAATATSRDLTFVTAELRGPAGVHATATALIKTLHRDARTEAKNT